MTEQLVMVTGAAEVEVEPDYASITLTAEAVETTSDAALRVVAARTAALDERLDALGAAVLRRVTSSLTVGPEWRWADGERHRAGDKASRAVRIEIADASLLGPLLHDAAAIPVRVGGIAWHVRPTNAGYATVRALAATDARHRAEAYAKGLGIRLGAVAWAAEPGLRGSERPSERALGGVAMRAAAAGPNDADEEPAAIDVVASTIVITARLEAAFHYLDPS